MLPHVKTKVQPRTSGDQKFASLETGNHGDVNGVYAQQQLFILGRLRPTGEAIAIIIPYSVKCIPLYNGK